MVILYFLAVYRKSSFVENAKLQKIFIFLLTSALSAVILCTETATALWIGSVRGAVFRIPEVEAV